MPTRNNDLAKAVINNFTTLNNLNKFDYLYNQELNIDMNNEIDGNSVAGEKTRKLVLGEKHIQMTALEPSDPGYELMRIAKDVCWGEIWNRTGIDYKTRSLITISILIGLNRSRELEIHIQGALNNGWTSEEIKEVIIHLSMYAGFPAAIEAMHSLINVLEKNN